MRLRFCLAVLSFFSLLSAFLFSSLIAHRTIIVHFREQNVTKDPHVTNNLAHDQLKAISEFCARHPELKLMKSNKQHMSNLYRHLLHVEEYKLLYCFVPKAGCTTVKTLVESLAGVLHNRTGSSDTAMYEWRETVHGPWERKLSLLSNSLNQTEILSSYYKFMILRDPVERILSAYKSKLEVPLTPIRMVGHSSSIRRTVLHDLKYKHNRTFDVRLKQDGLQFQVVPFEDYLHFLHETPLEALDMHFMPMYHMCNPCVVPYNLYSNFRTITDDIHRVLTQVKAPVSLYKKEEEHPKVEMKDFMDLYFGEMSSTEREQQKQHLSQKSGYTFEAAPSKDVPRQLLKDVFMKYSTEFDFYYSLFPDAEKVYKRYFPELDF